MGKYYEYRLEKKEKQKKFQGGGMLAVGAVLLVLAGIMTMVWYGLAG